MTDMLVSQVDGDRRLWHKVTSIGPVPLAGKSSTIRRFHLLCSYRRRGWLSSAALLVADGSGFIDDLNYDRVVVAGEPLDAEGRVRAHSPVKNKVRLCHICFGVAPRAGS